jgi:hypothetical protein
MWTMYAAFRVLRLVGFMRVISLKSFKDVKTILYRAIRDSGLPLIILIVIYMGVVLFFAIVICIPERGTWFPAGSIVNGSPITVGAYYRENLLTNVLELTPFVSVPAGMWWAIVTATTVGYGDVVPASVWGKILGGVVVVTGVFVIALPVAVIGLNFSNEYTRFHAIKRQITLSKDREAQERVFEKYKREVGGGEDTDKLIAHSSSSLIHSDSAVVVPTSSTEHKAILTADADGVHNGDQLLDSLLNEARQYSNSTDAGQTVVDSIEQLNAKIRDGRLAESDVVNFVRVAVNAIDASTIRASGPDRSTGENQRLKFHKTIFTIASQLIDRIPLRS